MSIIPFKSTFTSDRAMTFIIQKSKHVSLIRNSDLSLLRMPLVNKTWSPHLEGVLSGAWLDRGGSSGRIWALIFLFTLTFLETPGKRFLWVECVLASPCLIWSRTLPSLCCWSQSLFREGLGSINLGLKNTTASDLWEKAGRMGFNKALGPQAKN